jgi:hypothetical protein
MIRKYHERKNPSLCFEQRIEKQELTSLIIKCIKHWFASFLIFYTGRTESVTFIWDLWYQIMFIKEISQAFHAMQSDREEKIGTWRSQSSDKAYSRSANPQKAHRRLNWRKQTTFSKVTSLMLNTTKRQFFSPENCLQQLLGVFILLALLIPSRQVRVEFPLISGRESRTIPDILIVYVSCKEKQVFPIWKTNLSTVGLKCNPETNSIDCKEAVPMLNFFIQNYDRPLARKYIFLHAHETSRHYPRPVFDQVHEVTSLDYFRRNQFGAIFPRYCNGSGMYHEVYAEIFANTTMPPTSISSNNVRPCCATFFVDSRLVQTRAKSEYELIRTRLRNWSKQHPSYAGGDAAYFCGRVMEWNWHILLANRSDVPKILRPSCRRIKWYRFELLLPLADDLSKSCLSRSTQGSPFIAWNRIWGWSAISGT